MDTSPTVVPSPLAKRMRGGSRVGGLFVAIVGVLALAGWLWDIPVLKSLHPAWATIKANTAVCFTLMGAALWMFGDPSGQTRRAAARWLASVSVGIAALTVSQDAFGWSFGVDQLLFLDPSSAARPGRMAPNTAVLIMLLGAAIVRLDEGSMGRRSSQWLALAASVAALGALCGYLYDVTALYAIPGFGSLSLNTASCAIVLGVSVLAAQPQSGLMQVLSTSSIGGTVARRLFPAIILVPIFMGWLCLIGQQRGLYSPPMGLALLTVASILTIATVAWLILSRLIASELTHSEAEHAALRSQRLLQTISDHSPAVIYAKDLDGRYLFVNRRFTELFHVEVDGVLGRTDHDLFLPHEADAFRAMDRRAAASGGPLTEEESVPLAGASHTYISTKCPLRDEAGNVCAVFGMSTDITDRKRAEEDLRANEERTRLIIETALDAVVTMDTSGVITGWSSQAERMFGWTRQEAIGRVLADTMIPDRFRHAHRLGLERFLATGHGPALNTRLELSALHRDGREFPIELSITPLRIGETLSFSAFVRDITERKRMERALEESREHYQALVESLPHLVWTCRPDGYCDFLSRQWVEYTGRAAEQQLGFGWAEHLHPDDRDRVRAEWTAATVRGDRFDIEFRIRRSDGSYRWFKTRALPLRDAAGAIVKWFGSNTDFDDYKRSEQRLHAQLERLNLLDRLTRAIGERQDLHSILQVIVRSLEDHLPLDFCGIGIYDRADESLVIARIGVKSEALASDLAMVETARIPIDQNGLSKCVQGQLVYEPDVSQIAFPFPQRLARGGLRSLVAAPLAVESSVFGVLIAARHQAAGFSSAECEFLRQLSEHVALAAHQAELYAALQRAYDDLRQTQQAVLQQERLKALGQMASGIAHDINNAISPAALYIESLLETEPHLSSQARDHLSTIQHAIDDVAQTVSRMREFYRDREPQLALVPVDLNRLVREVVGLTRARWSDMPQQQGVVIQMSTELAEGEPIILGLESEIREALINLIFNAVDAMPAGGTLTLRTRTTHAATGSDNAFPQESVHVEVTDTGTGMDAETQRRCLEPFFTTKGEGGTGLGLAMVYGIVQRHGGDIDVDSGIGRGTTVRLVFAAPVTTPREPTTPPPAGPRSIRQRILIVDDDPLLLKSLRDVLEADGHLVTAVSGGQLGIDACRSAHREEKPFSVVITDLGMPYVDGRQVANSIKQMAANTPVILLTGWGQRLIDDEDVPSNVDRVLSKPPKLAELRLALAELTTPPAP